MASRSVNSVVLENLEFNLENTEVVPVGTGAVADVIETNFQEISAFRFSRIQEVEELQTAVNAPPLRTCSL